MAAQSTTPNQASTPDQIFAHDRLAPLYDAFEGERSDLVPYLALVHELGARTVLDVGCGTGSFAVLASAIGAEVTGVDPAAASLDVARRKPFGDRVRWHCGTAPTVPALSADLAVMTGNVAQVFLEDDEWIETLDAIRGRLAPEGRFVVETRRPEARAWESWDGPAEASITVPGLGVVRERRRFLRVELPFVSFGGAYEFPDGETIESESTLRFRGDDENRALFARAGLRVLEVRDAPDRPGLENVYVTTPQR